MAVAALAGHMVPHTGAWLAIDLLAGVVVLMHPKSLPQRAIGALFAGMALFTIGFIIGGQAAPGPYTQALGVVGWVQFSILLLWSLYDVGGGFLVRSGVIRGGAPYRARGA